MPIGLRNAPASFQALMISNFRDCIDDFVVIYMDDILVFSENREDHLKHLRMVLSRLRDHELYVGNKKCELMRSETEFLGLIVGRDGIRIGDDRKKLIKDWHRPTTITELRSFLGLVQFFRWFIRTFSRIGTPLKNLMRKHSCISNWDDSCDYAFNELKETLIFALIMKAPNWNLPFRCNVDFSQKVVGGTLPKIGEKGQEFVISYFSKRLSPTEENYSVKDRELVGVGVTNTEERSLWERPSLWNCLLDVGARSQRIS